MSKSIDSINKKDLLFVFIIAFCARLILFQIIPIDWNWDSYHHWQISYLSLKIGFKNFRFWDFNGCEYYWGTVPHFIQAIIIQIFSSSNIIFYRFFNMILGSFNALLISIIGSKIFSNKNGLYAGILYGVFPIAVIFDSLALQDTVALFFVLFSLLLFQRRPFWSGIILALAGQCRTEFILISFILVTIMLILHHFSTDILPFFIGWLLISGLFSYYLWIQTGNPFYSLYWSFFNSFGGWSKLNRGKTLFELFYNWCIQKIIAWPTKVTGIIIISSLLSTILYTFNILKKKVTLNTSFFYFLVTSTILLPTFITYFGSDNRSFIIMLRMINPIFALGLPFIIEIVRKYFSFIKLEKMFLTIFILFIISFLFFIPIYSGFQEETSNAFESALKTKQLYFGGKIACDYPTINYKFVQLGLDLSFLTGSHYAPHYYGASEPFEFVKWLAENKIAIWIYTFNEEQYAFNLLNSHYPKLFIMFWENSVSKIYIIDAVVLDELISKS